MDMPEVTETAIVKAINDLADATDLVEMAGIAEDIEGATVSSFRSLLYRLLGELRFEQLDTREHSDGEGEDDAT